MNLTMMNQQAAAKGMDQVEEILYTATVMHTGWECDTQAWLVRTNKGKVEVLTTNHGSLCKLGKQELVEKIKEVALCLAELKDLDKLASNIDYRSKLHTS